MSKGLGSRYASIREQQGFTQEQIADFLGIPLDKLIDFENGNARIGVSVLEKSCDLFGCTLFMMIGQEEINLLPKVSGMQQMTGADMEGLRSINKIALNLREMNFLLE